MRLSGTRLDDSVNRMLASRLCGGVLLLLVACGDTIRWMPTLREGAADGAAAPDQSSLPVDADASGIPQKRDAVDSTDASVTEDAHDSSAAKDDASETLPKRDADNSRDGKADVDSPDASLDGSPDERGNAKVFPDATTDGPTESQLVFDTGTADTADGAVSDAPLADGPATDAPHDTHCYDVRDSFSMADNPNPPWTYGWQDGSGFHRFADPIFHDAALLIPGWTTALPKEGSPLSTVFYNPTERAIVLPTGDWVLEPHDLGMHPGRLGEYSVVRWIAPESGHVTATFQFSGLSGGNGSPLTTTDVHMIVADREYFRALLNHDGSPNEAGAKWEGSLNAGLALDFEVGYGGNNAWEWDFTKLTLTVCVDPREGGSAPRLP